MRFNRSYKHRSGFTMVEMLLVVIVLMVLAGLTIPNLKGTYSGFLLKTQVKDLSGLMRYAQSRAVTQGKHVRLEFNTDFLNYWLTQEDDQSTDGNGEKTYNRITGQLGRKYYVPPELTIESEEAYVEFYPNGKIDKTNLYVCQQTKEGLQDDICYTVSTKQQRGAIHVINGKL